MLIWELSASRTVSSGSAGDALCDFGKAVTQALLTPYHHSLWREEGTLFLLVVVLHDAGLGLQLHNFLLGGCLTQPRTGPQGWVPKRLCGAWMPWLYRLLHRAFPANGGTSPHPSKQTYLCTHCPVCVRKRRGEERRKEMLSPLHHF